jgi:two-component system LytT family response regulator
MGIKVVIIDDEEDSIVVLQTLLKKYCANVTVADTATDIDEAYKKIIKHKPQAIFLDIQMPGGNGFDLLKKFENIDFDVVFVTSYDKYAIEAIRLSALHYMLKPIEVEELQEAVKRIERNAHWRELQNEQLRNAITNMEEVEKRITLHVKGKVEFVKLNEITHLESDRNYTDVYTKSNKKYTSSKNLGEYEEMLKEYDFFYRVNKGCIVNMNHVEGYSKGEPCFIDLMNNHKQEVSRAKKQELLQLLKLKPR